MCFYHLWCEEEREREIWEVIGCFNTWSECICVHHRGCERDHLRSCWFVVVIHTSLMFHCWQWINLTPMTILCKLGSVISHQIHVLFQIIPSMYNCYECQYRVADIDPMMLYVWSQYLFTFVILLMEEIELNVILVVTLNKGGTNDRLHDLLPSICCCISNVIYSGRKSDLMVLSAAALSNPCLQVLCA